MKQEELALFLDKYIKIYLKQKVCYTGQITSLKQNSLILLDKFGISVFINLDEISHLEEVKIKND